MVHHLHVIISADGRRHEFNGRSVHGAALVVSFREWLSTLVMPMAVDADKLEAEVVWDGSKNSPGLSSEGLQSTLGPESIEKA